MSSVYMTTCLVATDVLLSNCYLRLSTPPYLLLPLCQILSRLVAAVTGFLPQKLVWPILPSLSLTWFLSCFHHSKNHKTKLLSSSQSSLVFLSILQLDGMILSFHSLIYYMPSLLGTWARFIWDWNRGQDPKSVASKIISLLSQAIQELDSNLESVQFKS